MHKLVLTCLLGLMLAGQVFGQVYTNMIVGKENQTQLDSMKVKEYPYVLPVWGKKAYKKGYDLPYSAGISINYFWQQSDMLIEDLLVGFNGGPQYDLKDVVRINKATATTNAINIRPDLWVFPFLNVYGILAMGKSTTAIDMGLWIPDTSGKWREIGTYATKAEFSPISYGFGITPTIGVRGIWMAFDMNWTWTDIEALDKPVYTFIFGPRIGHTFKFKNPKRNLAIWAGGFRVKMGSSTNGSLNLADVIPFDGEFGGKIDNAMVKVGEAQTQIDNWWNGLSPLEQTNPINKTKYNAANTAIDAAGNLLTGVDGAYNTATTSTVQYSLNKTVKNKWNFILGTQFQVNKHFMIRAEGGFLGSRVQVMTGLQYRFGI